MDKLTHFLSKDLQFEKKKFCALPHSSPGELQCNYAEIWSEQEEYLQDCPVEMSGSSRGSIFGLSIFCFIFVHSVQGTIVQNLKYARNSKWL